jgi:uncharacterized protein YxjI
VDLETLQQQRTFLIRQKITPMVNRYVVTVPTTDGAEGELVAFVEQKRLAFREEVTFFADEGRTQPLFRFKARQVLDVGATYDVTGADGTAIGTFRKDFGKSLLRSTWHLEQGSLAAVGQERSGGLAIARRVWEMALDWPFPIPYHFDFTSGDQPVMSVDKTAAIRDRYRVELPDGQLDRRLAIAMAVALDALQSR